ncbi:MYG1 family protein [Neomegalonema sp.]|uniref:MYG1 family protein n=1 Tax=Neomegalonema sp. TaxID=2039713 RepID=UPI002629E0C9|nr:MYG1 family protein [Neomegalonema sp.]MDD2867361.1 MYG1 family protein [Neomegalonema sp.]
MTPDFLVTHSGGFHADELLSTVVLTRVFPEARLVRSREKAWTAPAPDRIVYDVGGAHDGELTFDHHQSGAPLREDGRPFSSFGLIWRRFGADYLRAMSVPERDLAAIHADFDSGFVLPVDLMDNGALSPSEAGPLLAGLTLPVLLETLKPVFDETAPDAEDRAFHAALEIARRFVEAAISRKAASLRARASVLEAVAGAGAGRVLELPRGMPFQSALEESGADHLLFVVHPRDRDWALTGVRLRGGGFAQRADLPEAWAGLTDAALEAVSGVEGARFCHKARFIAVAATREAALEMAQIAVREAERVAS